ncbi:MAG: right-handed parallel beta-helix repeat-containing protein [Eubacteriales bacterium]|nr:right-handed parallel beta-helix repeat-containing protein [Eubacteriales bacterium]
MLNHLNSSVIYVSPADGGDYIHASGSVPRAGDLPFMRPVQDVETALRHIRALRRAGQHHPITVCLDGDLYLDRPITIGPDVGELVFTSYPNTRARLIGGRRLTGFAPDRFNGRDCFSLFLPEVKSGSWRFTDLYVNGRRARPARYPESGTFTAVTTEFPTDVGLFHGSGWFVARKEDLAPVTDVKNAIVSFYHYWIDEHTPVADYDEATGRVTLLYRSNFQITAEYDKDLTSDLHYYLENVPEGLLSPGDWYLDVPNGMLYYVPADADMTPENVEVFAPATDALIRVAGTADQPAGDVRFESLDLLCTRGDYASRHVDADGTVRLTASDDQSVACARGAVDLIYARSCTFDHCRIFDVGLHAVSVGVGCSDIRVENCLIHDTGAGGVRIFGGDARSPEHDRTHHCLIRGNRILRGGRRYAAGCGVLICNSAWNEVSDNEIAHLDYTGVSVGWSWGYNPSSTHHNLIRRNHIHHIGQGLLSDMGAIYTLGLQRGTVIEDNVIHDVSSNHYGGWGIYTDEGSSYILIRRNIVYATKCDCFHQHYGSYNTVRENLFAEPGAAAARITRPEQYPAVIFEHNTVLTHGRPIYDVQPFTFAAHDNVVFDTERPCRMTEEMTLTQWQAAYGLDENTVERDPRLDVRAVAAARVAALRIVSEDEFD